MNFKSNLLLVLLLLGNGLGASAQNDVEFVIEKTISNYPGFGFKWQQSADSFRNWAKEVARKNSDDTFKALSLIIRPFRDQHFQIYVLGRDMSDDTQRCLKRFGEIETYLNGNKKRSPREGYWINSERNCVVGLRQVRSVPETYEAVVVENNSGMLIPGVVLGMMEKEQSGTYLTDFRSPFSKGRFFLTTTFRNDTIFTTGADGKWLRLKKYTAPLLKGTWTHEAHVEAVGQSLDSDFYLVRLPECSRSNIEVVDSLVKVDSLLLSRRKNLIIDIRGNMGSRSQAWYPLLPWVQTGPMAWVNRSRYATEDYLRLYLKMVEDEQKVEKYDSADSAFVLEYVAKIQAHIGRSFSLDADTFVFSEQRLNPQNVAVIMDFAVQSAAELLVLTFKQSKKVRFFGEHTQGAVDYLDYFPLKTPSGKYRLYIASTRRNMPAGGELDATGIYPDVNISDNEPDWIEFVKNYYRNPPKAASIGYHGSPAVQ